MVFIFSLQDMEGDNKVVNLIDDWAVLAEYAGRKADEKTKRLVQILLWWCSLICLRSSMKF